MTLSSDPVFPDRSGLGITMLEHFSGQIMAAMVGGALAHPSTVNLNIEGTAKAAVTTAKALIEELNK